MPQFVFFFLCVFIIQFNKMNVSGQPYAFSCACPSQNPLQVGGLMPLFPDELLFPGQVRVVITLRTTRHWDEDDLRRQVFYITKQKQTLGKLKPREGDAEIFSSRQAASSFRTRVFREAFPEKKIPVSFDDFWLEFPKKAVNDKKAKERQDDDDEGATEPIAYVDRTLAKRDPALVLDLVRFIHLAHEVQRNQKKFGSLLPHIQTVAKRWAQNESSEGRKRKVMASKRMAKRKKHV